MIKKILSLFIVVLFISQAYSLAGFGAYGNYDLIKYPSGSASNFDETLKVGYEGFDNAGGFGFLFYIDAIPFVDLEADIEFIGNTYKFTPYIISIAQTSGEMPWGRVSIYLTAKKEILGLSIPFLAKAQLYGGLGFNKHTVLPVMTLDMFQSAFGTADIESALEKDFSNTDAVTKLSDYMLENAKKISGFHLQAGMQGKLLMLNAFINARYTIAKDVIPGKSGFPSLWAGLALGI